jgi:hypothetical protein
MALETNFDFPDSLNPANPADGDNISDGDDHIRGVKTVIRNFAQDFNGQPLDKAILAALFPPGVLIAQSGDSGNPGNQIGGTWQKFGEVKTVASVDEEGGVSGAFPESPIHFFYRIA